jgi:protein gp37
MGSNSKIEWCDCTFNPWRGCTKVSDGCKNCYALALSKRNPKVLGIWGPSGTRVSASESYWKDPETWDAAAAKAGERHRVFCASMGDVFEDHPMRDKPRAQLWDLIRRTPNLDWLLLTKRPRNIMRMIPQDWAQGGLPANVWAGTSVEDQSTADERIPHLLAVPARVRFLSCEPLLGLIDLAQAGAIESAGPDWAGYNALIDWVICGGESGNKARPMHPNWARSLRDQCQEAAVPYFFKQHGEWLPLGSADEASQYPRARMIEGDNVRWVAVGKGVAGRMLDGQEWDEFPT